MIERWSTLKKLIWLHALRGGGQSGVDTTVSGTAPIALENALSAAIMSLVQYGKCSQDGTPTPSTPVDIVCNNGALKLKDTHLPAGFTPVKYIESDGTSAYIDTGIILNSIDLDVEVDFQFDNVSASTPKMFWGYMDGSSNLPRWGFGVYNSKWLGSPNGTAPAGAADTDRHTAVMHVYHSDETDRYSGTLDGDELYAANTLGNVSLFLENDLPVFLFARNNKGTAGNFGGGKIYGFKVTKAGTVTHELIPCLNAENEPGFYDLNTQVFHGATEGTLTAGGADFDPATSVIYSYGTPEVLTVSGTDHTQTASVENLFAVGNVADEKDIISGHINRKVAVKVFNGTEEWSYSSNGYTFDWYDASIARSSVVGSQFVWCTHFRSADTAPAAQKRNGYVILYNTGTPSNRIGMGYDEADKDVDVWKVFLASQYAAGTPVIAIYPLAEPTTESVAPQELRTSEGANVVSVEANVSDVTLEAKYKAKGA